MVQSPSSEANSHSGRKENFPPFITPMVHYRVHKSPALVPNPNPMHPVNTFPLYFPEIHSNIIFSYMPMSSECFLPFMFLD